jgi:prepilin-type N-terminal cleavage/methylation domain-containing protein
MRKPNGFTLIELLVVIVIIAVLAALITVVTTRMFETTRRTQCAANLGQLAKGFYTHADENDNWMAAPDKWPQEIARFIAMRNTSTTDNPSLEDISKSKAMICPSAIRLYGKKADPKNLITYARNDEYFLHSRNNTASFTYSAMPDYQKIKAPSKTMVLVDATFLTNSWNIRAKVADYAVNKPVYLTHRGEGVNVSYVDGRATWILKADMPQNPDEKATGARKGYLLGSTFWRGQAE